MFRAALALALACHPALVLADVVVATQHFELRSDARSNLHHFLLAWSAADRKGWPPYALAVAERESWRVLLDDKDARAWAAAVDAYAATVNRDVLFDEGLIALRSWAAGGARPESVPAADRPLIGALEAALPIYEKYWWRSHDAANRAWIGAVGRVLRIVDNEMARRLAAAYGGQWPEDKIPVDVVIYASALGGYTTGGRTTISSTDPGYRMPQALEMIFHEASHVDGLESPLTRQIDEAFQGLGRKAPERFWHDMIFFTAGTVTRIVLEQHAQPGYKHYGEFGVYRNARWETQLPLLKQYWAPFLESGSADAQTRAIALKAIAEGLAK